MPVNALIPHFQELLDNYKDGYMGAKNLAQSSRQQYENELHLFLLFLQELGVKELKKVDTRHINEYMILLDKKKLAGSSRRGFWPNPSKWFNPEFPTNPTSGNDFYNSAKSSNFHILILESLPLVFSLN